jgi:hypothetical protein
MGRRVPGGYRHSERGQVLGPRGVGVATGDRDSTAAGDQSQPAHPSAAYPQEVDRASIRGIEQCHRE